MMVGMILAENEDAAGAAAEEQQTLEQRREAAWAKLEDELLGLKARGDLSAQEYDDMRSYLRAERDIVRDARKAELERRQKIRQGFAATLPAPLSREAAYDVARGAALRADGDERPVENRIGRKLRRERARQQKKGIYRPR